MKLINTVNFGNKTAKVYFNSELKEYQVKLFKSGKHEKDADYFTDDKADANGTAEHMVGMKKEEKKKPVSESIVAIAIGQLLTEAVVADPVLNEAGGRGKYEIEDNFKFKSGERGYFRAMVEVYSVDTDSDIETGQKSIVDISYKIVELEVSDQDGEELVLPTSSPDYDTIETIVYKQLTDLV